jgi:hypothetical protein
LFRAAKDPGERQQWQQHQQSYSGQERVCEVKGQAGEYTTTVKTPERQDIGRKRLDGGHAAMGRIK